MHFYVFRCSTDRELFLAVSTPTIPPEALTLCAGEWKPFRNFPRTGAPRLAFPSEEEIIAGIQQKGYMTFRAGVYVKSVEVVAPPPRKGKKKR